MYSSEDLHDCVIGNFVRDTIYIRDYELTELSRDQLNYILQYTAVNY